MIDRTSLYSSTELARNDSGQALGQPTPNIRFDVEPDPQKQFQLPGYFGVKYRMDRVLAWLLLPPALPVMFLSGCLIRFTSRGPALYRQKRVGLNGKVFSIYKIRTMKMDAEAGSGPVWSTGSDPRITRAGRLLRFLHLDELPQLFNVIQGHMSIVGPRPERPDFVRILVDEVDGYADRLKAKPGITGLAQIYLPPDQTYDCVRKKVCFDRAYIESASLKLDLQILLCTALRIIGIRGGRGPRWFGLDRRFSETAPREVSTAHPDKARHNRRNGKPNGKPALNGTGQVQTGGIVRQDSDNQPGAVVNGPFFDRSPEKPGKPR